MKITIEPTAILRAVDGTSHREWRGVDDEGVPVVALVRAIMPDGADPCAGYHALCVRVVAAEKQVAELREAGSRAEARLNLYADMAHAGKAEGGGRAFARQIRGAFAEFRTASDAHEESDPQ